MVTLSDKKIELEYPCEWIYKIIGQDKNAIKNAIKDIILEKNHTLNDSNRSSSGKYISLGLKLIVVSEDERVSIYESLRMHKNIMRVL